MIADRNYCYVCRVGVTYDEEKIKNTKKISLIHNTFLEIKKGIQLFIDFDPTCDEFWMYHYKKSYNGTGQLKWRYLKSYIDEYIYRLYWNDKYNIGITENVCVQTKHMLKFKFFI